MTSHTHPDNGSGWRREDVYTYYEAGPSAGLPHEEIIDANNFAITTTYEYDLAGNAVRIIDPRGHDTRYIYDQRGRVVRETSPEVTDGSGIRYTTETYYDQNNNVVQVDVANIDEEGNTRPNAWITTSYDYEALNQVIRTTQEVDSTENVVTEYEYDANRNETLIRYGEATGGDQDPETFGAQPTNTLSTQYDERNLVFRESHAEDDPLQSTVQYDYDGSANPVRQLSGLEDSPREYLITRDGYDRVITQTDPMGNVNTYSYDAKGNLASSKTEGGLVDLEGSVGNVRLSEVTYTYDAMDRQILAEMECFDTDTQLPILDGKVALHLEYSDNSQILATTDDNGHRTETAYGTADRVSTITDAKGNTLTYIYDDNSNPVRILEVERSDLASPDEHFVSARTYDNLNRLLRTTDNANHTMAYRYDSRDNQVLKVDALGNTTRYEYDGLARLITTSYVLTDNGHGAGTPVDTIVTRQAWDDSDRLFSQTDDNDNSTLYQYDPLGQLVITQFADSTADSISYNVHGNTIRRVDANGTTVASGYDLLGRLTGKTVARAQGVIGTTYENYQYDGLSRTTLAEDNDSRVERSHDSLGRITSETQTFLDDAIPTGRVVTSEYDGAGNLLSCTYPVGRELLRTFDELDRVSTISDGDEIIATYAYIGPYRVEQREYPKPNPQHTTRTTYSYDSSRRITGTTHVRGPELLAEVVDARTYTWDPMSNKTGRRDIRAGGPRLVHQYSYDSAYRLRQTTVIDGSGSLVRSTGFDVDGVGNRMFVSGDSCAGAYTLNDSLPEPADFQVNQYSTTPCDRRSYDRNGNLVSLDEGMPTARDISYDYMNQVVLYRSEVTGDTIAYAYDVFGRRIRRFRGGTAKDTTQYMYDGWQVIEEYRSEGAKHVTYVYGNYIDEILSMRLDGLDYYYHSDDGYSVMAITDPAGQIVERCEYLDYGEPECSDASGSTIPRSTIGNDCLFTGRRYDWETGHYSYRTRYFDPVCGRFISRDAVGMWADQGNLGNAYTYAGNNPGARVDPFGLSGIPGELWTQLGDELKSITAAGAMEADPTDRGLFDCGRRLDLKIATKCVWDVGITTATAPYKAYKLLSGGAVLEKVAKKAIKELKEDAVEKIKEELEKFRTGGWVCETSSARLDPKETGCGCDILFCYKDDTGKVIVQVEGKVGPDKVPGRGAGAFLAVECCKPYSYYSQRLTGTVTKTKKGWGPLTYTKLKLSISKAGRIN
jgi:RHS repeat-associated protein